MRRVAFLASFLALGVLAQAPFVSNFPASKTAVLQVIAGYGSANGGFNFDGGFKGNKTFVVPFGWTVKIEFKNLGTMPHSLIVIPKVAKIPLEITPGMAAFPHAYTKDLNVGIPPKSPVETIVFKADRAGDFYLICGVPGHGVAGQYINLVVSKAAKAARFY